MDKELLKKKWKMDSTMQMPETFRAKMWVQSCYRTGLINWKAYQKALDKVKTAENGSWMFEGGKSNGINK